MKRRCLLAPALCILIAACAAEGPEPYTLSGVYTVGGAGTRTEVGRHFQSEEDDVSAIFAEGGARLSLRKTTVATTGDSSSRENSDAHGLNAAVLVVGKSAAALEGGSIDTKGLGASGAFAGDPGSKVWLSGVVIRTMGRAAHGVDVGNDGNLTLVNADIETLGNDAAGVATDQSGGTVAVTGGRIVTHGKTSPGVYSAGDIGVSGASIHADASEAAIIDGEHSLSVQNSDLFAGKGAGVMLYQSRPGDSQERRGHFAMSHGALRVENGPAFFVINGTGLIDLENVAIKAPRLLEAKAGHAVLTARAQQLTGDLIADEKSSITATLGDGSELKGAISGGSLTLDADSRWTVTGDSAVREFDDRSGFIGGIFNNIDSQGHTVTYDPQQSGNSWLGGYRYPLPGGGSLAPAE